MISKEKNVNYDELLEIDLQTFPNPTDMEIQDSRNSMGLSQVSRPSAPSSPSGSGICIFIIHTKSISIYFNFIVYLNIFQKNYGVGRLYFPLFHLFFRFFFIFQITYYNIPIGFLIILRVSIIVIPCSRQLKLE